MRREALWACPIFTKTWVSTRGEIPPQNEISTPVFRNWAFALAIDCRGPGSAARLRAGVGRGA